MTYLDKLKIVHNVLVNKESRNDTAKQFRVSPPLVTGLTEKVKKNPKFLEELKFELDHKQEKAGRIIEAAKEILANNKVINKADEVKELLVAKYGQ